MVDVMSRGSVESSIRVPASAGVIPLGGSYIGATEVPGSGSLPTVCQTPYITANVSSGKNTIGLLPRNQNNFVIAPGSFSMPLGMKTSMVMPPRIGSDCVVSNVTSAPFTSEVAFVSVDP